MTEQEAAAFAERLTRIWGANKGELMESGTAPTVFLGVLTNGLELHYWNDGASFSVILANREQQVALDYSDEGFFDMGSIGNAEFISEWLPFFRRGCWLSGCPIEATAHEKAEWMQGFSREELEAWNLKM